MWSDRTAYRYDQWARTPEGRFVLSREHKLLQRLIAPWPRKRQKLLDIGCGTGFFLNMFWDSGFDVTGLDSSPEMVGKARERMGQRADFHLGSADSLPFEDKEFDFSALITVLEFCNEPEAVLMEAARVTRKGVLVAFLNQHSLYFLLKGKNWSWSKPSILRSARWFSYWRMRKLVLSTLGPKPLFSRSVLPGPPLSWREIPVARQANSMILPPFAGSFVGIRIDLVGDKVMTPLLALKGNADRVSDTDLQPVARTRQ